MWKIRTVILILSMIIITGLTVFFGETTLADWRYTIRRGDTLFKIARRTGVTVRAIKNRNGLTSNRLRIGQRIMIPSGVTNRSSRRVGVRHSGELDLLARVIHAEAGAEPYVGKVAVGGVILNRVQNRKFPKTVAGVIYQPHAFESVSNGFINRPANASSRKAARDALAGWDPSGGALYFFNPAKTNSRWIWARRIINRIGKHVFSL
ncbi:MAG TPA: cell wall hydrolase [Bacillota bacterium]